MRVARPVEQHVDHRLLVEPREAGEEIDHLIAPERAQASDHAEIDDCDAVVGKVEHVARMRIGVKEPSIRIMRSRRVRRARRGACGRVLPLPLRPCSGAEFPQRAPER